MQQPVWKTTKQWFGSGCYVCMYVFVFSQKKVVRLIDQIKTENGAWSNLLPQLYLNNILTTLKPLFTIFSHENLTPLNQVQAQTAPIKLSIQAKKCLRKSTTGGFAVRRKEWIHHDEVGGGSDLESLNGKKRIQVKQTMCAALIHQPKISAAQVSTASVPIAS